jgi:hypothetical protein
MGLFKEILIDKKANGKKLNDKIVVIAACNPYLLKKD